MHTSDYILILIIIMMGINTGTSIDINILLSLHSYVYLFCSLLIYFLLYSVHEKCSYFSVQDAECRCWTFYIPILSLNVWKGVL